MLVPRASPAAESWPARPVRFVMSAPAGSSIDVLGRVLGSRMKAAFDQPFVVENLPGAGGTLAMTAVARAAPDGHTFGIGFNGPLAFAPFLYSRLAYDPQKDLRPVVLTTAQPNVLAVAATLPVKSVAELIAYARARPGQLNYASVGSGSSSHLTMALMRAMSGLDIVHVPYNGSPPALNALASGDAHMIFAVPTAIGPLAQAGKVRMLAVTSARRWPLLPQLPTVAESGLAGFDSTAWNGVVAPDGTAADVVQRLNRAMNAALHDPEVKARLNAAGLDPVGGSPEAFGALIRAEADKWGPIIRRTGARVD
ncbi:MAG: Bug family tripartite tricarboxylate transporter substrate binding protein [Burkholderiales bacterium]